MRADVGACSDFSERRIRVVEVGDREIGIVRWNGAFYAVNNLCAHQSGPLCAGALSSRLTADIPGSMELDDSVPVLACPWHGWEFDVRTGRGIRDRTYRARTYRVEIADGRVLVDLGAKGTFEGEELP